jgi:hypothetical protein
MAVDQWSQLECKKMYVMIVTVFKNLNMIVSFDKIKECDSCTLHPLNTLFLLTTFNDPRESIYTYLREVGTKPTGKGKKENQWGEAHGRIACIMYTISVENIPVGSLPVKSLPVKSLSTIVIL